MASAVRLQVADDLFATLQVQHSLFPAIESHTNVHFPGHRPERRRLRERLTLVTHFLEHYESTASSANPLKLNLEPEHDAKSEQPSATEELPTH